MRRLSFLMLSGLLAAFAPAVPAAAREQCGPTFEQRLGCWSDAIRGGTVRVTLDRTLPFDGSAEKRKGFEQTLSDQSGRLLVEVPSGVHTGAGGSALLVLADSKGRLVADDAVIDKLKPEIVTELAGRGACHPRNADDLCARLGKSGLSGRDLIDAGLAADLSRHAYTVTGSGTGTSATPTGETAAGATPTGKQGQGQGQNAGRGHETGNVGGTDQDPAVAPDPGGDSGWDTATQVLTVLCAVLVLLLGLLLFLIRRSARSVAIGSLSRRSLAAPGVGPLPAASAPRPRGRPRTHAPDEATTALRTHVPDEATTALRTHVPDEATTRLRATPAPRSRGRRVGNVPGPARPAVVRTELHPQGYVEVDHVLYRAVWAEPGRPPPTPGGLVDVTEAGERDSDVLYAFPPTPGRHAKAARP
ncbi:MULTISPECIES: hypothetical protein [unclassified Streptomyces]|uniref:hypothetical protein n=1 Tax=unclassified Streptomyces TaxID=2593676 RepID=UPI0033AAC44C